MNQKYLDIQIIEVPKPVFSDGVWVLVYELILTNLGEQLISIEFLEIQNESISLLSIDSTEINKISFDSTHQILPAEINALFLWIRCASVIPPSTIHHEIVVSRDTGGRTKLSKIVQVNTQPAVKLGQPLGRGQWLVKELNNGAEYRRALNLHDDIPRFAQRFALEWRRVDNRSHYFRGDDSRINENYYSHGGKVYAVEDGTVTKIVDGYLDNTPGEIADDTAPFAGNHLLLTMNNGDSAVYGHLLNKSIKVTEGSRVQKGEQLARVGNSGISKTPHLYFHVVKLHDPNYADGFNGIGRPFTINYFWTENCAGEKFKVVDAMPSEGSLIRFLYVG